MAEGDGAIERVLTRARADPEFDTNVRHVYEKGDFYWWRDKP